MRLHWGTVPEDKNFQPEAEDWLPIREPTPLMMQFIAIPVALIIGGLLLGLVALVFPNKEFIAPGWLTLFFLVTFIPIHELLHAVCFPGSLWSDKVVIGIWTRRLLFYAHYEGVMSRNQLLLTFAMPFIVLSLLPTSIIGLFQWPSIDLVLLILLNGISASGDVIGLILILAQIPKNAVVRNQGWRSYWKSGVSIEKISNLG
jgi:hypothetical protein